MKLTIYRYPSNKFLLLTAFLFFCNCFKICLSNITTTATTTTIHHSPIIITTTTTETLKQQNYRTELKLAKYSMLRNGLKFKSISNNNNINKKSGRDRIGVIITDKNHNITTIRQGFKQFLDFFKINIEENRVDFLDEEGLSGFVRCLENVNYTTVIKALNNENNYNFENDFKYFDGELRNNINLTINISRIVSNSFGYCHLGEGLSKDYNKTILLWPCSNIKVSNNFLPSFEAISFAVKSITKKLNWTEAIILVADSNWGLPLTIASNLEIPYSIKIGLNNLESLNVNDKIGKVFIIILSLKDPQIIEIITKFQNLNYTKILLIDIESISFNIKTKFYENLLKLQYKSKIISNLLILTILSDKYRYFLNVAFDDNEMKFVKKFRSNLLVNNSEDTINNTNIPFKIIEKNENLNNMTTKICEILDFFLNNNNNKYKMQQLNEIYMIKICNMNLTIDDIRKLNCLSSAAEMNFTRSKKYTEINLIEFQKELKTLCKKLTKSKRNDKLMRNENGDEKRDQINLLKNLINFFHFYDFLATYLIGMKSKSDDYIINNNIDNKNKFDFIVLDIIKRLNPIINDTNITSGGGYIINDNNWYKDNENSSIDSIMWRPFLILEQNIIDDSYTSHPVHPGYWEWVNDVLDTNILSQCGVICWSLIGTSIVLLLIIIAASVTAGIAIRHYLLRKRLSSGPNKIVLSVNDFVFPVDNRRVDEGIEAMLCCWLQQLQEFGGPEVDKPDLLKGSIGSLKHVGLTNNTTTSGNSCGVGVGSTNCTIRNTNNSASGSLVRHHHPSSSFLDMRARYNGDLVQLKEVPNNGSIELKSKAMDLLVVAHGLRHENLNPLLGWLSDPTRTALVFDYCSRGSLQDVLIMDEIKLDWSFRLSLLTDLVRGMRYLHSSPLRVHGSLTSRNCVVDARWVLKITDYCLPAFYDAQGIIIREKTLKDLFWMAPELLRNTKGHSKCGTQMGDVYAFGIIMQEVVLRGEPYCMLSLSIEEIISKIKKPPPLIRPSVSKGAAPPEAINIMRQCWAEQPDMRPDFNSVYERFKMLNHGRKVNFVDTMFQMLEKYSNNLEELIRERTEQLDIERKKTEQLLNRMLPSSVAEKLKMGLAVDPEEFSDVTIYFSDIVGFTTIAAHCSPVQVVDLLNDLYTIFDATINAYNVYKVETIGDAYMVVSGLPVKIQDHAEQIATMALDLLHESGSFKVKHLPGVPLQLRIGLHTGPCCAGVVGLTMPRYCLFGDTVNTASRMESTGSSSRIHMSEVTRDRLEAAGGYNIEARGPIEIKGKGMMNTFWLLGKNEFDKPLPSPPPVSLDESIVNKCTILKPQSNSKSIPITSTAQITPTVSVSSSVGAVLSRINSNNNNSTNPSSRSSSIAGDLVDVKVEITPPINNNNNNNNIETSLVLPNLYSLDNTTISPNLSILSGGDIQQQLSGKISPICIPQPPTIPTSSVQRKLSELTNPSSVAETLLNPANFNRLPTVSTNNTTGSSCSSSSRLYKKIEEMIDLSSPYNHYKCLSPSENNLSQFADGKYIYSKMDSKPGSSRLLRRQFSLDRDDGQQLQQQLQQQHQQHQQLLLVQQQHHSQQHHLQQQQHQHQQSTSSFITTASQVHGRQSLEIPVVLQENRWSPKNQLPRLHKQNSSSIAQDLEKIEETPMSPSGSSHHHSSLESSLNRSPPTPSAVGCGNGKNSKITDGQKLMVPSDSEQGLCLQEGNNVISGIGSNRSPGRRNKELTLTVETLMTR